MSPIYRESVDRSKSLQELEEQDWGESEFHSRVAAESHRLRRVPLCELTIEDLRFMIVQHMGLRYLVPLALEKLHSNPFVAGDCYEGDLLAAVLRADASFWVAYPSLRAETTQVAQRAFSLGGTLYPNSPGSSNRLLRDAYDVFRTSDYLARHRKP